MLFVFSKIVLKNSFQKKNQIYPNFPCYFFPFLDTFRELNTTYGFLNQTRGLMLKILQINLFMEGEKAEGEGEGENAYNSIGVISVKASLAFLYFS